MTGLLDISVMGGVPHPPCFCLWRGPGRRCVSGLGLPTAPGGTMASNQLTSSCEAGRAVDIRTSRLGKEPCGSLESVCGRKLPWVVASSDGQWLQCPQQGPLVLVMLPQALAVFYKRGRPRPRRTSPLAAAVLAQCDIALVSLALGSLLSEGSLGLVEVEAAGFALLQQFSNIYHLINMLPRPQLLLCITDLRAGPWLPTPPPEAALD